MSSKPVELKPGEGVIRCPAVRSLIKDGKLNHEDLKTAAVQDLVHALSGQQRDLVPTEAGSLANIGGFFAILNHGAPVGGVLQKAHDALDATKVAAGKGTSRRFDLRLFRSRGDHPGTVNFFKNDEAGEFQPEQFTAVMKLVADGETLTIQGIAKMIIMANDGTWDEKGSALDLAKSAGEWGLMVCVLRTSAESTDISVADLQQLYSRADSTRLLIGSSRATARDWVKVTAQIAAAIAAAKAQAMTAVSTDLHATFADLNTPGEKAHCPCQTCNPDVWNTPR